MIKFFSHIRKKLFGENKLTKYLLYALGEIILVVIGILIALKVNNNNSERLFRIKEKQILTELQEDLQKNLEEFDLAIQNEENLIENINQIFNELESDSSDFDRIGELFPTITWSEEISYVSTSYSQLNNLGIELISNDTLRRSIVDLYDVEYPKVRDRVRAYSSNHFNALIAPIILEYLRIDSEDVGSIINTMKFKNDPRVLNLLGDRRYWKKGVISFNQILIERTKKLDSLIANELKD